MYIKIPSKVRANPTMYDSLNASTHVCRTGARRPRTLGPEKPTFLPPLLKIHTPGKKRERKEGKEGIEKDRWSTLIGHHIGFPGALDWNF